MARECPEFSRLWSTARMGSISAAERWIQERHLAACEECRAQHAAHETLSSLKTDWPERRLSQEFNAHLRARLLREEPAAVLDARARRWLRLYWSFAIVISIFIVLRIDWPQSITGEGAWYPVLALVGAYALYELLPSQSIRKVVQLLVRE